MPNTGWRSKLYDQTNDWTYETSISWTSKAVSCLCKLVQLLMKESLKIKERVIELHKLINFHSYNYHSLDSPSIEDHEYDAYEQF